MAACLIECPATELNKLYDGDAAPMHLAVMWMSPALLGAIIKSKRADLDLKQGSDGRTALHLAVLCACNAQSAEAAKTNEGMGEALLGGEAGVQCPCLGSGVPGERACWSACWRVVRVAGRGTRRVPPSALQVGLGWTSRTTPAGRRCT
jgi:hypothetical protein